MLHRGSLGGDRKPTPSTGRAFGSELVARTYSEIALRFFSGAVERDGVVVPNCARRAAGGDSDRVPGEGWGQPMKPHHRELFAWLRSIGARHVRVRHHGERHPRIAFNYEGDNYVFTVPGTPSDHRGLANQIAALRRQLIPAEDRSQRALVDNLGGDGGWPARKGRPFSL
jgi:hypothetical protein